MLLTTPKASAALFLSSAHILSISIISILFTATNAADYNDWRSRSIYQLIVDRYARTDVSTTAACDPADQKYCGGTWQGIINKLDYIADMGFTAIWISPLVKNIGGNAQIGEPYHGFWSQDITSLNPNFGTADDLKALSKALNDRDMVMPILYLFFGLRLMTLLP